MLGDLDGRIGDRMRVTIIGGFIAPERNYNGKMVIDLHTERGLCVCNKYFVHKILHKYTRVAIGYDGLNVLSMIDLVLV